MRNKRLYSPEIDNLLEWLRRGSSQPVVDHSVALRITHTLDLVKKIKPKIDINDRRWTFWLRSERGDISAFGSFEEFKQEGEVKSYEEFKSRWKEEYPDEIRWHHVALLVYHDRVFIDVDAKCQVGLTIEGGEISGADVTDEDVRGFVFWLLDGLETEVNTFLEDPPAYNRFITSHLPLRKRIGRIRRKDLWESIKDAVRQDEELGAENLKRFDDVVENLDESVVIPQMTANDFLRYCELGYDANGYFRDAAKAMSSREKYQAFADNRHGGLLDIDPDSAGAFKKWYEGDPVGGTHPWEICRGGNTTHVSLGVARAGGGWKLYLAGFHRAVEVARMAIALFKSRVPFVLYERNKIRRKLHGVDYLGIVPDHVSYRDCHDMFPKEDQINDFLNPWHDADLARTVEAKAYWYPIEELHVETGARK